jgi:membrane protease YdiL (CAAX protease family)
MSAALSWPRKAFIGPSGVRAGWRLLFFAALVFGLNRLTLPLQRALLGGAGDAVRILTGKARLLAVLLAVSWLMARLERRTLADYGLPWRHALRREFWQGAALGFAALTGLVALLWLAGALRFGGLGLHGAAIPGFALAWALAFLLVGVQEECYYRGYGLFTLADGIGFWPAALLLSAAFGASHLDSNANETWLGALNAGFGGLVFCLFLRRTGDLWFPIGFHTSWNWAQTYFYGVAVSGHAPIFNLLSSTTSGPAPISGGRVGPEGSVLCLAVLVAVAVAFAAWRSRLGATDVSSYG